MSPVPALPTIIVYGNIASGKSTLSRGLLARWPAMVYACMDRLRAEENGAHTNEMARDRAAERRLLALAAHPGPLLYETSGATHLYRRMFVAIVKHRGPRPLYILTHCTKRTAMERAEHRRATGHIQYRPAAQRALSMAQLWDHFDERVALRADLTIDTENLTRKDCLGMAIHAVEAHLAGKRT